MERCARARRARTLSNDAHLGLLAAGMVNANGNWTGKYGIHSRSQFLADHDAQDMR
jgi:hypothetical protein